MAFGTTTAILGAAAIGGATSLFGANKAAKAQRSAARGATRAAEQARADLQPYRDAGSNALGQYMNAVGLSGRDAQTGYFRDFQDDPYMQNILQSGTDAITNSAAARGTLYGGNTLAAVSDFGGQLRKSAYDTRLGQLGGLVDTGRSAAGASGAAGQTGAAQAGGLLSQAGQTMGAGFVNAGNAVSGGLNNLAQYNMFQQGRASGGAPSGYGNSWSPWTVNSSQRYF